MAKDKKDKSKKRKVSRSRSRSQSQEKKHKKDKQNKEEKKGKKDKQLQSRSNSSEKNEEFKKPETQVKQEESDDEFTRAQQKLEEGDLIDSLKEQPGFLAEKYNEKMQEDKEMQKKELQTNALRKDKPISRAGGVYVPPHKLRQLQQEILETQDNSSKDHQKLMWELLRKSINGVVNKVNISNIQNVIIELLNENILRGKGLLARAIIKAQMTSPNFTHVYAALISVVNTKLPEIVNLIIRRVILQFQTAYKRNNKIVCQATLKMLAHLINQQVLSDYVALQILMLFLEDPTEDTVELSCEFLKDCGQILSELSPPGVNAIFERLKGILHEGEIDTRVQYNIENIFAVRKNKFKDHPGVIPELDLVELEDQITHNFDILEKVDTEDRLNIFQFDPFYEKTEQEWDQLKLEILGEENLLILKEGPKKDEEEEEEEEEKIQDLTEEDRVNLRRTIYLVIMSSIDFEQCAHKILKMNLGQDNEHEVVNMIVDCCMNEKTYITFYGLLAQRFCEISDVYRDHFMKSFIDTYSQIHNYETNKIRNSAKLFAHLLYKYAVDWRILSCITLTQQATTASSRIFIKNLIQEMSENLGLQELNQKFLEEDNKEYFAGLFPTDQLSNTRFAINFFTSVGVGGLTEQLREFLQKQTEMYLQQEPQQIIQQLEAKNAENKSDSSDSDDSDSDSSSSSSDSDSDSDSGSDSSSSDSSEDDSKKKKSSKKQSSNSKKDDKKKDRERDNRERDRDRERERDRDRDRERNRERERDRDRERNRDKERERDRNREKERDRDRERERDSKKKRRR